MNVLDAIKSTHKEIISKCGLPKLMSHGIGCRSDDLGMNKLGQSLAHMMKEREEFFTHKTIVQIGIQLVSIIL